MAPESTTCESHFAREIMSLLKRIKVEKSVLASSSTRAYSSLSKKDLDNERTRELEMGNGTGMGNRIGTMQNFDA